MLNEIGAVLLEMGEVDEALTAFEQSIKVDPDDPKLHVDRGIAQQKLGKLDGAIASFQRAIDLNPDSAIVHFNLGLAHWSQCSFEQAIQSLRTAIAIEPDHAAAHRQLGGAYAVQGRIPEAITSMRHFLRLEPDPLTTTAVERLDNKDSELLELLKERQPGNSDVQSRFLEIYRLVPFPDPPQDLLREFWNNRRNDVLRELEQRTVTMIRVPRGDGAQEIAEQIRNKLLAGIPVAEAATQFQEAGKAVIAAPQTEVRENFHPSMQETIFATPAGGVGEIVDFREILWVLKVDAIIPGAAERFEDDGVEEAAMNAFERHRREEWEKRYLEDLKKRIEKEGAGKAPQEEASSE